MIESLPPDAVEYWGYTSEGEEKSAISRRRGNVWKHSPPTDILRKLPLKRAETSIYLVSIRPWWDRVGSYFFHAKKHNRMNDRKYPWVADMSISEFIRSGYMADVEHLDRFCTDETGEILVDYFIDYPGIAEWYVGFMEELGVSGATLPAYNRGRPKFAAGYRNIFSPKDFEHLSQAFSGETALLGRLRPAGPGLLKLD